MNSAVAGVLAQLGAAGLAPVPAPAGHPGVVAPHHLAGIGMLDHRDAVGCGVEGLVAGGADQPRRAGVAGQVLPAERDLVQHRDRVVAVGEPVDPGQPGRRPGAAAPPGCCGCAAAWPRTPGTPPATPPRAGAAPPARRRAPRGRRPRPPAAARRCPGRPGPGRSRRRPPAGRGSRAAARTPRRRHRRRRGTPRACPHQTSVASDRDPGPTPGSNTVRAKRATCAELGFDVSVGQVTGERRRVSGGEYLGVLAHPELDLAVQDQEQLAGSRRVRLAGVALARPERPVPQLGDVRRLGAGDEHGLPAELAPPQHRGGCRPG